MLKKYFFIYSDKKTKVNCPYGKEFYMKQYIYTIIALLMLLGCKLQTEGGIHGDNNIVEGEVFLTQFKSIDLFTQTYIASIIDSKEEPEINIIKSNENKVVITTDENILKHIIINDNLNTLSVQFSENFNAFHPNKLKIDIYTNNISQITNSLPESKLKVSNFTVLKNFIYDAYSNTALYLPENLAITESISINNWFGGNSNIYGIKNLTVGEDFISQGTHISIPDVKNIKVGNILQIEADLTTNDYNISIEGNEINLKLKNSSMKKIESVNALSSLIIWAKNITFNSINAKNISFNDPDNISVNNLLTDDLYIDLYGNSVIDLPTLTNIKNLNINSDGAGILLSGKVEKLELSVDKSDSNDQDLRPQVFDGSLLVTGIAEITMSGEYDAKVSVIDKLKL